MQKGICTSERVGISFDITQLEKLEKLAKSRKLGLSKYLRLVIAKHLHDIDISQFL